MGSYIFNENKMGAKFFVVVAHSSVAREIIK